MTINPKYEILNSKQYHEISNRMLKKSQHGQIVMLNLFQYPVKSIIFKTLKQVQGDRNRLFQHPAKYNMEAR